MRCKDGSHVENCIIKRREDEKNDYLFFQDGDKRITAYLNGYAIIPIEEYNKLHKIERKT